MIAKLKGVIDSFYDTSVILDVNGVGYQVFCSSRTLSKLGEIGEACALFTEMVVREDLMQLYGFLSLQEREWFRLLTSVQGVGNRVGMALLSIAEPGELARALAQQDSAFICQAEGVGPKLATRLIHELKGKVMPFMGGGSETVLPFRASGAEKKGPVEETISALLNLGYRQAEAVQAVHTSFEENKDQATVETLIKASLMKLAKG